MLWGLPGEKTTFKKNWVGHSKIPKGVGKKQVSIKHHPDFLQFPSYMLITPLLTFVFVVHGPTFRGVEDKKTSQKGSKFIGCYHMLSPFGGCRLLL